MKILYLGTVCDLSTYENMLNGCKRKPTIATIVFESALLEGFKANGADIDVLSYPMIPCIPYSKYLYWGNKEEKLKSGYTVTWLKTINFQGIKQISRCINARKLLKKWIKKIKVMRKLFCAMELHHFWQKCFLRNARSIL